MTKHPKILTFGIVFVASIAMTVAIGTTINNLTPIFAAASHNTASQSISQTQT